MSVMVYKLQEIHLHQVKIRCTFGLLYKVSRFLKNSRSSTDKNSWVEPVMGQGRNRWLF